MKILGAIIPLIAAVKAMDCHCRQWDHRFWLAFMLHGFSETWTMDSLVFIWLEMPKFSNYLKAHNPAPQGLFLAW